MPAIRDRAVILTGLLLARIALRYAGAGYVYGGNASAVGDWDCSSFVSYVLHRAGLALPNGKWGAPGMPPSVHGPVVVDYANWAGATTVGQPQAGDLCCWVGLGPNGHIGIAVNGREMVSALNPTDGTLRTPIVGTGPSSAPLIYRRVNGLAGGGGVAPVAAGPGGTHPPLVVAVVTAGVFMGAALLVVAGAAGLVWAVRQATA